MEKLLHWVGDSGQRPPAPPETSSPLPSKTVTLKGNPQDKVPLVLRPGPPSVPRGLVLGLILNIIRLDSHGGEGTDLRGH